MPTNTSSRKPPGSGHSGKFITVEGPDGTGKSTAVQHIAQLLRNQGIEVVTCRLPGGTAAGDAIRDFFKSTAIYLPIEDQIAMLMLAKRQMLNEVVKPALAAGKYVISDRYTDSLYAYQWAGFSEFDPAIKQRIDDNLLVYGIDLDADLKIVLDCPIEMAMQRMGQSRPDNVDVLDKMNLTFKRRISSYYRDHLKESTCGQTVFVNTVQGLLNTSAIIERLVSILMLGRLPVGVPVAPAYA